MSSLRATNHSLQDNFPQTLNAENTASRPVTLQSQRIPWKLSTIIFGCDVLALTLAFVIATHLNEWIPALNEWVEYRKSAISVQERFSVFAAISAIVLATFWTKGHYTKRIPWWGQVQLIAKMSVAALLLDGFIYFSTATNFSRYLVLLNWTLAGLLLLGARQLAFHAISSAREWHIPVAIIGCNEVAREALNAFAADGLTGYDAQLVLCKCKNNTPLDPEFFQNHPNISIINADSLYDTFIRNNPGYFYVISLDSFHGEDRSRLISALEDTDVEYAVIPPTQGLDLHGMVPHYFFGNDVMLLHKDTRIFKPINRFFKRTMDIVVSGIAMIFVALLGGVVYVAKKIEGSKAPLLYNGKRIGKDGKLFPCWKFCTMKPNADRELAALLKQNPQLAEEWEKYKKLKKDPRIDSNASKFLRKTSLDELPQLWSVFVGDMSLVGPRPILPDQKEEYGKDLKYYTSVRPGLTGLWQVSGRNETTFEQRIHWDNWYIRHWSLWHDVIILFKTVRVLLTGSGAY